MATAQRIYLVTIGANDRLVRASSKSQALHHVARDISSVKVASQDMLVECMEVGVKVETAGAVAEDEIQ